MSRAEELPNEKLWVRFLVRMEEVTDRIAAGETAAQIVEKAKAEGTGYKASVEQMYYGNQQFLFVYEQFDDVRLVAAPPSSIGKFGGDPATRAISRCSASTLRRTTVRRPTHPRTSPTVRKNTSAYPRKGLKRAISR